MFTFALNNGQQDSSLRYGAHRLDEVIVLSLLVGRFRWVFIGALVASAVAGASSVFLVSQISAALTSPPGETAQVAVKFAVAAITSTLAGLLANILFERLRQQANAELRRYISQRVMAAPLKTIEDIGTAKVQSALAEHTTSVAEFFVSLPGIVTNGVIVAGCFAYLVILSPKIFLLTLLVFGLGSLGYHYAHLQAIKYLRAGSVEQDRLHGYFRSLTEGAKELRLNSDKRRVFESSVLGASIDAVRKQRTIGMSIFIAASSWGNFLIYAFLGLVLFVIASGMSERAQVMTGFALLIVYIVTPLQSLLLSIPDANMARVASQRIKELTDEMQVAAAQVVVPMRESAQLSSLSLRGVTHRYYHELSNDHFQLGPVDLDFHPGQVSFIVGGNGSGKTTLAKLIVGLYAPERGHVLIDGVPAGDARREVFSTVFSDFHLFDSLLEHDGGAALDEAGNRLLTRLHLQHKVQMRDGAFTTRALSQGQRKRLALVIAYLEDRPVLVFDEWAADQDPTFKELFYHEVLDELRERGKLVIVITHDDRYFPVADQLIRMDNGQISSVTGRVTALNIRESRSSSRV
jgi:putative pyoverdin transport system ATP-binding/permease protein